MQLSLDRWSYSINWYQSSKGNSKHLLLKPKSNILGSHVSMFFVKKIEGKYITTKQTKPLSISFSSHYLIKNHFQLAKNRLENFQIMVIKAIWNYTAMNNLAS